MTQHPNPSAEPVSEPALFSSSAQAASLGTLICPAEQIFDRDAMVAQIRAMGEENAGPEFRSKVVTLLRDANKAGRATIAESFASDPFAARRLTRSYTYLTDCLVDCAVLAASEILHPLATPTKSERIAVMAVGGYGRGEMAPFSDVDLLFLTPYKITAWAESVIESTLYILWDLRLKVGHSSRTIKDCIRLGAEDYTIRTAMLEHRFLVGHEPLALELAERLQADLFSKDAKEFVDAKLAERDARHLKQGERYVVEPNVKEGKGGLRDLQSLFWIAKYIYQVRDVAELVPLGVFKPEEFDFFAKAENFLWATRAHLHLAANRATEQLTFDMQVQVAERMGYEDKAGRRAVEVFMQDYFIHATQVGDVTRILLTKLEDEHRKNEPLLERIFRRRPKVKAGYEVSHNRLGVPDPQVFLADPLNLLRLFEEALRTGMLIHPDAMRLVRANLHLINDDVRKDREARRIFLDLLLKHGNPERALRRMNELGLLSAFIPEFETIVAMMQFNMYHSYTVDEHTIQVISNFSAIEKGELEDELPLSSALIKKGVNRNVLMIAMLLHDIGKGRPQDHSILGAQIARKVAPRLGFKKQEVETIEWLVRYHLLMSDTAQKRDIADPRTVRDFAKAVGTVERLDLLLLLTVCDIRGVGPGTWNNWKAALLRALHSQTREALENGMESLTRAHRGTQAKANLAQALPDWPKADLKREKARHYPPYWQGLHVTAHVEFAQMLRDLDRAKDPSEVQLNLHPDEVRDATRICFATTDHPGIFARIVGALALVGANVVDARSYTTKDGYVTDTFWIQDAEGHPFEAARLPRLRDMILKTLQGKVIAREAFKSKDKIKKRERAFRVPTHITFDNEGSDIYTIIEVDTRDRPGLLHDLARTFAANNVYVANAVIATYGEQVVDAFYVKDMFGLKYHSESKQKSLEAKLRKAIKDGAERADT